MAIAKQIEGYPDYYVSSAGNVWREHRNEFYLKLRPDKQGLVGLCTNGERKRILVHRLVAMAFVPIPSKYADMSVDELEVHHVDFNHSNNRASNLQWLTKAEHMQLHSESEMTKQRRSKPKSEEHKQKIGEALKGKLKGRPKPEGAGKQPRVVIQYTKDGEFVAEYASTMEAERQTKVNHSHICSCCNGKRNSIGGYKWAYLD